MNDLKSTSEAKKVVDQPADPKSATPGKKLQWETPKLEDVSEQVMAQPYIRFT
jgi:hypothetical protein